ncbi:MAG: hypothetical protein J0H68_08690 [Sphingobacteriia bacterium]|nr:hypothetical protein [Sphingobacteriia bacterium]
MAAKIKWTQEKRNLLVKNELSDQEYEDILFEFIKANEGVERLAYDDGKGKITVGIGFNMSDAASRVNWIRAFKKAGIEVSFDDVYNNKRELNENEIKALYNYSVNIRRDELIQKYGNDWYKLKPNERLAIEDAYYNSPKLVYEKTRFYKHIKNYINSGKKDFLEAAVYELEKRSNPEQDSNLKEGIQNRRNVESEMLKTYETPWFKENKDLNSSLEQQYDNYLYKLIIGNKEERCSVYDSKTGKSIPPNNYLPIKGDIMIGCDFNMNMPNAKKIWDEIFNTDGNQVSFDNVYNGNMMLSFIDVKKLHTGLIKIKEIELLELFGEDWFKLKLNERFAIEVAYYNNDKPINKGSNFYKGIKDYISTQNKTTFKNALAELKEKVEYTKIDSNEVFYQTYAKKYGFDIENDKEIDGFSLKIDNLVNKENLNTYVNEGEISSNWYHS